MREMYMASWEGYQEVVLEFGAVGLMVVRVR